MITPTGCEQLHVTWSQKLGRLLHFLSTSRYTRELEAQRNVLLARVDQLELDNLTLMRQVYPSLMLGPAATPEVRQAAKQVAMKPRAR